MNKIFKIGNSGYYISSNVYSSLQSPLRKVESYEIELYTTATNISVVNGTEYEQKIGNILIAKPQDLRYSINHFECCYVHFLCGDTDISNALNSLPTVFAVENISMISEIFKNIISAKKSNDIAKQLYTQGKLAELISLLIFENNRKYNGIYKRYVSDIESVCDFLKNNFEQRLTLADLAASVNLSPGFFHKVFKSVKGTTPERYLTDIRLNNAANLLKNSSVPPAEIAVLCGFGSQSYFNFVFKKNFSDTPKKYRDKNQIII